MSTYSSWKYLLLVRIYLCANNLCVRKFLLVIVHVVIQELISRTHCSENFGCILCTGSWQLSLTHAPEFGVWNSCERIMSFYATFAHNGATKYHKSILPSVIKIDPTGWIDSPFRRECGFCWKTWTILWPRCFCFRIDKYSLFKTHFQYFR